MYNGSAATTLPLPKRRRRRIGGQPSTVTNPLEDVVAQLLEDGLPVAPALGLRGAQKRVSTDAQFMSARQHERYGLPRLDLFHELSVGTQPIGEVPRDIQGKSLFQQVWILAQRRAEARRQATTIVVEDGQAILPHAEQEPHLVAFFDAMLMGSETDPKACPITSWKEIWQGKASKAGAPRPTPGEKILDWAFRDPGRDGLAIALGSPIVARQGRKRRVERIRPSGCVSTIQPMHLTPEVIWTHAVRVVEVQPRAMRITDAVACYLAMSFELDTSFEWAVRLCRE